MPRTFHHHELFNIQRVGHCCGCAGIAPAILEVGIIVHLKIVRSLTGGHRITRDDRCDQGRVCSAVADSYIARIWVRASR
jgi:hypothetical protein